MHWIHTHTLTVWYVPFLSMAVYKFPVGESLAIAPEPGHYSPDVTFKTCKGGGILNNTVHVASSLRKIQVGLAGNHSCWRCRYRILLIMLPFSFLSCASLSCLCCLPPLVPLQFLFPFLILSSPFPLISLSLPLVCLPPSPPTHSLSPFPPLSPSTPLHSPRLNDSLPPSSKRSLYHLKALGQWPSYTQAYPGLCPGKVCKCLSKIPAES